MKIVYLVNEADNFHSLNSFRLVGIATSKKKAIKLIKKALKEVYADNILNNEMIFQLVENNQTQQSVFDWEYNISEVELNKLN